MADQLPQAFDPSKLMEGVRDRIKATFVSLMPDGVWEGMVKTEVDKFFKEELTTTWQKSVTSGYSGVNQSYSINGTMKMSPFTAMVHEFCREKTSEYLRTTLKDELFSNYYPLTADKISPVLKEVVEAAVPLAMKEFFESIAFHYMNQLRQDIQNRRL
jgi:hypothetical protein